MQINRTATAIQTGSQREVGCADDNPHLGKVTILMKRKIHTYTHVYTHTHTHTHTQGAVSVESDSSLPRKMNILLLVTGSTYIEKCLKPKEICKWQALLNNTVSP